MAKSFDRMPCKSWHWIGGPVKAGRQQENACKIIDEERVAETVIPDPGRKVLCCMYYELRENPSSAR